MTPDEFIENVAKLVAGLQVPVSMMPHHMFGAAYKPWETLLNEVNGGFGWTDSDKCQEAFRAILAGPQADTKFADYFDHME